MNATMVEQENLPGALIYSAMSAVMADVEFISKDQRNTQGAGFNFRGVDDVYNSLHSILAKHKVFAVPTVLEDRTEDRKSSKGTTLIYRVLRIRYRFYTTDGSFVDAIVLGEAMDTGDKASNKAMSIANKYAFIQVFCIPTKEQKDPDAESHELASDVGEKTIDRTVYDPTNEAHKIRLREEATTLGLLKEKSTDEVIAILRELSGAMKGVELSGLKTSISEYANIPFSNFKGAK